MPELSTSIARELAPIRRPPAWRCLQSVLFSVCLLTGFALTPHNVLAAPLSGTFKGEAYGTLATALVGPIATILGKTAYLPCPCQGTNGATQQTSVNALSAGLGGRVLTANVVTSTVYGLKTTSTATATNTSTVTGA